MKAEKSLTPISHAPRLCPRAVRILVSRYKITTEGLQELQHLELKCLQGIAREALA